MNPPPTEAQHTPAYLVAKRIAQRYGELNEERYEFIAREIEEALNHTSLLSACEAGLAALVRAAGVLPPHYGDTDKSAWQVDEAVESLRTAIASARKEQS